MLLHDYVWGDSFLEYNMDHDQPGPLNTFIKTFRVMRYFTNNKNKSIYLNLFIQPDNYSDIVLGKLLT